MYDTENKKVCVKRPVSVDYAHEQKVYMKDPKGQYASVLD